MCGLAGFICNSNFDEKTLSTLCNNLARQAMKRGEEATGIAFVQDDILQIHKEARPADEVNFTIPANTKAVVIHTRLSSCSLSDKVFNDHPFYGKTKNGKRYALSHNGLLQNFRELRERYKLPETEIETDSYVAVQLLNQEEEISFDTLTKMAEAVEGSFVFTILEEDQTLWIIRADNPLILLQFPRKNDIIIYGSTPEILCSSLVGTVFFEDVQKAIEGDKEAVKQIKMQEGQILKLQPQKCNEIGHFKYIPYKYSIDHYHGFHFFHPKASSTETSDRIDILKTVAHSYGYSGDDIDELIDGGFTVDEIEEELFME